MTDVLKDVQAQDQVSLSCLLEFSDIRQDKFEDILERIIFAFGIDFKDESSRIDFDMYVKIKCFLTHFTIEIDDLKKIWLKILNPSNMASLAKDHLMDLFERFARGKIQSEKILVSAKFSENMIELLEKEGCENPEEPNCILMAEVSKCLDNATFDIELFNQMIKTECQFRVWSKNIEFE